MPLEILGVVSSLHVSVSPRCDTHLRTLTGMAWRHIQGVVPKMELLSSLPNPLLCPYCALENGRSRIQEDFLYTASF